MAVLTVTATERATVTGSNTGFGRGGVKHRVATTELAAASSSSTIAFFKIPSRARICQASRVYFDDLATSGSPTLDIGLIAVNGNITSDDDALNDGLAVSSVSTAKAGEFVVKDFANAGKQAWEYVANQTSDPGGELLVQGVIRDAATTATGTVTLEILYDLD